jgi:methanogenic corrinoid protein MtbC1
MAKDFEDSDVHRGTVQGANGDPLVSSLARQAMAKVVADVRAKQAHSTVPAETTQSHVTAMALALADTNHGLAEEMVEDLLNAGLSVKDLCLDHLAPAARELGLWWKRDTFSFADVTLATARIQSILRKAPRSRAACLTQHDHGAVFVAVPGETHTLGVIMAADHFRRLGWDVSLLIGMDHKELCRRITSDNRSVMAVSCSGRHSMTALRHLVDEVRWQRPDMSVILSGLIAQDETALATLPKFDGVVQCFDESEQALTAASLTGRRDDGQESRAQA